MQTSQIKEPDGISTATDRALEQIRAARNTVDSIDATNPRITHVVAMMEAAVRHLQDHAEGKPLVTPRMRDGETITSTLRERVASRWRASVVAGECDPTRVLIHANQTMAALLSTTRRERQVQELAVLVMELLAVAEILDVDVLAEVEKSL